MLEACIVCLGDLGPESTPEDLPEHAPSAGLQQQPLPDGGNANDAPLTSLDEAEAIAHLLPCGHNLHNDCLKPWVERANSCPICRASFNMVELSALPGGPVYTSYTVADKQQVADVDPSLVIDDEIYDVLGEVCHVCDQTEDNGDEMMICASCDRPTHVFCAGLSAKPAGPWFCHDCIAEREPGVVPRRAETGQLGSGQAQTRRRRPRRNQQPDSWARVWQAVWDRLNFDLDMPSDDDVISDRRTAAQRREFREYQRRYQVAARNGAGDRFRRVAPSVLDTSAQRDVHPTARTESQEELRAWREYEKAKEQTEGVNTVNSRKRKSKSATASPREPERNLEQERKFKRPRTRWVPQASNGPEDGGAESSSSAPATSRQRPAASRTNRNGTDNSINGPSFLQSLLSEVETYRGPSDLPQNARSPPVLSPEPYSSPGPSSPEASPPASGSSSPIVASVSPPPHLSPRSSNATPLASSVQPVFPAATEFSPFSPIDQQRSQADEEGLGKNPERLTSRPNGMVRELPHQSSPSRNGMSLSTKTEIQRMVKAELKPRYQQKHVNAEQYTNINKEVSRLLYHKVKSASALSDSEQRARWQRVAAAEVDKAINAVQSSGIEAAAS